MDETETSATQVWSEQYMCKQQLWASNVRVQVKVTIRDRWSKGVVNVQCPLLTMFSLRKVLRKRQRCRCSSVGPCCWQRGPSRSQLMQHLTECNSGLSLYKETMRSAVVQRMRLLFVQGGHGACGSKLNQVFVGGSISRDTSSLTIDRTPGVAR